MTSPRAAARTANNGAATALPLRAVRARPAWTPPRSPPRGFNKEKTTVFTHGWASHFTATFNKMEHSITLYPYRFFMARNAASRLRRATAHASFAHVAWLPAELRLLALVERCRGNPERSAETMALTVVCVPDDVKQSHHVYYAALISHLR